MAQEPIDIGEVVAIPVKEEPPVIIPEGYVPVDYTMDPSTEELLFTNQLRPGMVVLLNSHTMRNDPENPRNSIHYMNDLDRVSRWCQVQEIHPSSRDSRVIVFIGVYSDGTKQTRAYGDTWGWLVKKDSIPETEHEWMIVQFVFAGWTECKCSYIPESQEDMDRHSEENGMV